MTSVSFTSLFFFLLWDLCSCRSIPARDNDHNPTSQFPTAKVKRGTYIGIEDTNYGVDIWAGIRYAKPPTGSLRLQPPEKYEAEGTINSQQYGNRCFAIASPVNVSEDCLTLNIYAPPRSFQRYYGDGLPVMFYIHGGGYNQGSGITYAGQSLINRSVELESPVIIVTINYRLSFFGFSGDPPQVSWLSCD